MSLRNRVIIIGIAALILVALAFIFAPVLVSNGVRLWVWWKAKNQKLTVTIDRIEAPLFHPVSLVGVKIVTGRDATVRVDASAARVTLGLNLKSMLLRTRGRAIGALSAEDINAEIHQNNSGSSLSESGWNTLHRLLPDNFKLERVNLRIENGTSVVLVRNVSLSGSQIEAGRFSASELIIVSSLFRQTFRDLRAATNWQNDRLTIAGMTLSRGLDLQSITSDLSRLGKRRLGLEVDLDTFGGKIRGSLSTEWRSHRFNLNAAGSASDISISQTAEALGFTNRVGGLLHAGKFTFRGNLRDPIAATTSLWAELRAPAWRDREADVIMLGLASYKRQIQLQQLYVKQRKNQLTLSGEGSFPTNPSGWLHPDFRGNISASINDLGDFASLFGADRGDFAGQIAVEGVMNARERNFSGHLTANGSALTVFKSSVESFTAECNLKPTEIGIEQLELKRNDDFIRASGTIETAPPRNYSGKVEVSLADASGYLAMFCPGPKAPPTSVAMEATIADGIWETHGTIDPPRSYPLTFAAKFPLPLDQGFGTFWSAQMRCELDFPRLALNELPGCLRPAALSEGSVVGRVMMQGTPRHPQLEGNAQLVEGRLLVGERTLENLNIRVGFHGPAGQIEYADVGAPSSRISFFGDIDLHDTNEVGVHLFPSDPLVDASVVLFDCAAGLEFVVADRPGPRVAELDLRGSLSNPGWVISLREPADDWITGAIWDMTRREFSLCRDPKNATGILRLATAPQSSPTPTRPPPRKKRR